MRARNLNWPHVGAVVLVSGVGLILLGLSIGDYGCVGGPGLTSCVLPPSAAYALPVFIAGVVAVVASGALLLRHRTAA